MAGSATWHQPDLGRDRRCVRHGAGPCCAAGGVPVRDAAPDLTDAEPAALALTVAPAEAGRGTDLVLALATTEPFFDADTALAIAGAGVFVLEVLGGDDDRHAAARVRVAAGADRGTRAVVASAGGRRAQGALTIVDAPAVPRVLAVAPDAGRPGERVRLTVTCAGTSFTASGPPTITLAAEPPVALTAVTFSWSRSHPGKGATGGGIGRSARTGRIACGSVEQSSPGRSLGSSSPLRSAVRLTLAMTSWSCAPSGVRLPAEILRVMTPGRISRSASLCRVPDYAASGLRSRRTSWDP